MRNFLIIALIATVVSAPVAVTNAHADQHVAITKKETKSHLGRHGRSALARFRILK